MIWHVGLLYRNGNLLRLLSEAPYSKKALLENFPTFYGVETERLVNIALTGKWIQIDDGGVFCLTTSGEKILGLSHQPRYQLRLQIKDLLEAQKPFWITLLLQGRKAFASYAPPVVVQCFQEAGLLDTFEQDVVQWLDHITAQYRQDKNSTLLMTGRKGERLSFEYERIRTGKMPYWIALDYEGAGYDIVSVMAKNKLDQLLIEVKASIKQWKHARFHLTRNEWEALNSGRHAVLHLWCITDPPCDQAIIPIAEMNPHIPKDKGKSQWEVIKCPFSIFSPGANVEITLDNKLKL